MSLIEDARGAAVALTALLSAGASYASPEEDRAAVAGDVTASAAVKAAVAIKADGVVVMEKVAAKAVDRAAILRLLDL